MCYMRFATKTIPGQWHGSVTWSSLCAGTNRKRVYGIRSESPRNIQAGRTKTCLRGQPIGSLRMRKADTTVTLHLQQATRSLSQIQTTSSVLAGIEWGSGRVLPEG